MPVMHDGAFSAPSPPKYPPEVHTNLVLERYLSDTQDTIFRLLTGESFGWTPTYSISLETPLPYWPSLPTSPEKSINEEASVSVVQYNRKPRISCSHHIPTSSRRLFWLGRRENTRRVRSAGKCWGCLSLRMRVRRFVIFFVKYIHIRRENLLLAHLPASRCLPCKHSMLTYCRLRTRGYVADAATTSSPRHRQVAALDSKDMRNTSFQVSL
jgi:hypothetical protein